MEERISIFRLSLLMAVVGIYCSQKVSIAFVAVPSFSSQRQTVSRKSEYFSFNHPTSNDDIDGLISKPRTSISHARGKSFMDDLVDRVLRNDTSPITFTGYITAKRSLSKHLVFLDFCTEAGTQDNGDDTYDTSCQALLRREQYTGPHYSGYQKCLHKGTKLVVVGYPAPTNNPGNAVLSIQSIERLLGVPHQVQHLECILRETQSGGLPIDQVSMACQLGEDQLKKHLVDAELMTSHQQQLTRVEGGSFFTKKRKSPPKPLRDLAKKILNDMDDDPFYPTSLVDDRARAKQDTGIAVPEAPLQWQQVPSTILQAPIANYTSFTKGGKDTVRSILQCGGKLSTILGNESSIQHQNHVSVEGWIQNRRRYQNDITVVVLVDEQQDSDRDGPAPRKCMRLECVLHPKTMSSVVAAVYRNLMAVGCKISIRGWLINNAELGTATLWATSIRLLHVSPQPAAIHLLLDLVRKGDVGLGEGAAALHLSLAETEKLTWMSAKEQKWMANKLAATLQESANHSASVLAPEVLDAIETYSFILDHYPVKATQLERSHHQKSFALPALPIKTLRMPGSRWETKKRPQIEWMTQQIQRVLLSHPDFGKRKLRILDIGGGKGLLAHHLAQSIDNVQIHVVDICQGAVANGLKKGERAAKTFNTDQSAVSFQVADASCGSDLVGVEADVVVALHACGHLTDVALAHAVQRRAGFVIAPCCFNSNRQLTLPTQSERASPVHEWHGVSEHNWAMLKSVAEIQGDIATASKGMNILCGLRAQSVERKLDGKGKCDHREYMVEILAFPIEYSTRNLVMVGQVPS